jgi:hypothetical protein
MKLGRGTWLALLVVAGAAHGQAGTAAALNGKWLINLSVMGNDASFTCDFTTAGKDVKGGCGALGNATGSIDGGSVTIKTEGGESPLAFTGVLKEGELKGTVDVLSYAVQGEFTGRAVK